MSDSDHSNRGRRPAEMHGGSRRDFLKKAGAVPVGLAAARYAPGTSAAPAEEPKLPRIQLGAHSVSRLVCGANPFNGGSHLSVFFN